MVVDVPYKNLTHTLKALKIQVQDSMPYISKYIPLDIYTPEDLFYYLKGITEFKNDPQGVELLQTVQTLFKDRILHNIKYKAGQGDCDDLTIAVLSMCTYLNFKPQFVALTGRTRSNATHIYSLVWDKERNKLCSMDLTNEYYDMERDYPYKQILKFNL